MTAPAAITATFSDFRLVKTRKLAQLIFELPIEEADRALASLGGLPRSDMDRWCAIARLNKESAAPSVDAGHGINTPLRAERPPAIAPSESVAGGAPKQRRHFSELPRSAQAAMLCGNPVFQKWICEICMGWPPSECPWTEGDAAHGVRLACAVSSRGDFDIQDAAAERWDALHARYRAETGQEAEAR